MWILVANLSNDDLNLVAVFFQRQKKVHQDTFDHDKGQKSAISGRCSTGFFFAFSPVDFYLFLQVYCVT